MLKDSFKERMMQLLGGDYESFISALEKEPVRGVRANRIKTSTEHLLGITSLDLVPLSYLDDGFILREGEGVGNTPEHHAGMFYVQDPGAMAAMAALDISPEIVDPDDIETLSDIIIAAVNEAIKKVEETNNEEMSKITGNMSVPGLF